MSRRWLVYLPLALTIAGAVVLPAAASAAGHGNPPPAACTKDTQAVTDLTTAATNLGTALSATPPDATKVSQAAGGLFKAVTAGQTAGCLPDLPSPPPAPAPAPPPPAAKPMSGHDAANCGADTVKLLSAALDQVTAATANPVDPAAMTKAAAALTDALTAINTDTCLPVSLPLPSTPAPPAPPAPPAS
ncbi:MAG TPA: hypothetical protein VH352_13790 [Pseudonocardiaceae bacterium]|nr:hypothetical protein [Pseudonocardiaceae bacterium]